MTKSWFRFELGPDNDGGIDLLFETTYVCFGRLRLPLHLLFMTTVIVAFVASIVVAALTGFWPLLLMVLVGAFALLVLFFFGVLVGSGLVALWHGWVRVIREARK